MFINRSSFRARSRARAVALGAAVALASAVSLPSAASATDYIYGCPPLNPNSWCSSPGVFTFGFSAGYETNNLAINMCAKLTAPNDENYYYGRKCENTSYVYVWSNGGGRAPYPNNSVDMRAWHANGNNANVYKMHGFAQH